MAETSASTPDRAEAPLDTTLLLVSPENIAFHFRLAGPATRAVALAIDLVVMGMVAFLIFLPFTLTEVLGSFLGLLLVVLFFLWWGYGAAFEVFNNGQTLGKASLGLRVVSQSGLTINASQAVLRNLIRGIDVAWPLFPGVVSMVATSRFQRLGDLAAGTVVVLDRSRRQPRPPELPEAAEPLVGLIPHGFTPGPALAQALAEYVGRRGDLTPGRRRELAGFAAARLCAAWGVPPVDDPDALLCAVYETTVSLADEETA